METSTTVTLQIRVSPLMLAYHLQKDEVDPQMFLYLYNNGQCSVPPSCPFAYLIFSCFCFCICFSTSSIRLFSISALRFSFCSVSFWQIVSCCFLVLKKSGLSQVQRQKYLTRYFSSCWKEAHFFFFYSLQNLQSILIIYQKAADLYPRYKR